MGIRESYEQKLNAIYREVVEMSHILMESLEKVEELIQKGDASLVEAIKQNEEKINARELHLEDQFIVFIATEAPVASDLRKIVSSIKIVSHLERMGDYVIHVTKKFPKMHAKFATLLRSSLMLMVQTCRQMLQSTMEAYMKNDVALAEQTAAMDDVIDKEQKKYLKDVFKHISLPGYEKEFSRALFIGRSLERLGDHITNICEWIVYAEQFKHVELNP